MITQNESVVRWHGLKFPIESGG